MNDLAIGRTLRALRRRQSMRQADVGRRSGVSQQLVSRIERGRLGSISHDTLRRVFAAVEADLVTIVRWRGGELDRLLDEGHAALVGRIVMLLQARGWEVLTEVTFSEFGERGSIDVLAWHAPSRTLLVIEVKTEIASVEETLRRHDVKVRLAPAIARQRFGAAPTCVGRMLVVEDRGSNRRRVARLAPILSTAYPDRGPAVRAWLAEPSGDLRALLFTAPIARPGRRARGEAHRRRRSAAALTPTAPSAPRS